MRLSGQLQFAVLVRSVVPVSTPKKKNIASVDLDAVLCKTTVRSYMPQHSSPNTSRFGILRQSCATQSKAHFQKLVLFAFCQEKKRLK